MKKNNTYVYILNIDTSYYVLYQIEEFKEATKYKLNKKYQGMLAYLFKDYPELKEKVWDLEFSDKEAKSGTGYGAKYKLSVIQPEVSEKLALIVGGGYQFFKITSSSFISSETHEIDCFTSILGG